MVKTWNSNLQALVALTRPIKDVHPSSLVYVGASNKYIKLSISCITSAMVMMSLIFCATLFLPCPANMLETQRYWHCRPHLFASTSSMTNALNCHYSRRALMCNRMAYIHSARSTCLAWQVIMYATRALLRRSWNTIIVYKRNCSKAEVSHKYTKRRVVIGDYFLLEVTRWVDNCLPPFCWCRRWR